MDVILGLNGEIWVYKAGEQHQVTEECKASNTVQISKDTREKICRVRNCVLALAKLFALIHPESINSLYEFSMEKGIATKDLSIPKLWTPCFPTYNLNDEAWQNVK